MAPQSDHVPESPLVAYVSWLPRRRLQEPDLDALATMLEGVDPEFCLQHDAADTGSVIVSLVAQSREPATAARDAASTVASVAANLGLQGEVVNVEVLDDAADWTFNAEELGRDTQH